MQGRALDIHNRLHWLDEMGDWMLGWLEVFLSFGGEGKGKRGVRGVIGLGSGGRNRLNQEGDLKGIE